MGIIKTALPGGKNEKNIKPVDYFMSVLDGGARF
jgi:hypothetical protein